ncbi:MAG TPA: hypothetical protein VF021_03060, partial [Longimicrobiales bacterium]
MAAAQAPRPDTAALLRQARRAEAGYEFSIRRNAPNRQSASDGRECDEQVGRYCVIYDTGQDTLPTEPARVASARDSAISTLSRAYRLMPANSRVAGSLSRLLVSAGRPAEAVEVARSYARASDRPDRHMLLGFALHAAGQTDAALEEFNAWLGALPLRERTHIEDIRWLLSPAESRLVDRLSEDAHRAYVARAWRFADPLYLTTGNELLADHYARHALARMLRNRPVVMGSESWGADVEQLTIRFGAPVLVTRHYESGSLNSTPSYSEHWDPAGRAYFPPDRAAFDAVARIDTIWPVDSLTARSGHAPPPIRLMRVLEHQAVRLPGNQLIVAGSVQLDSAARGRARPVGRVFVLDSLFEVLASAAARVTVLPDSVLVRSEIALPAGARFYSAELLDSTTWLAARARFLLPPAEVMPPLSLSGLLLCEQFGAGGLPLNRYDQRLRPLSRPVLAAGQQFGVYGEIISSAPTRRTIRVELETRSFDRGWAVARLGAWIGSRLGFSKSAKSAKLSWTVEVEPSVATPLALTIDAGRLAAGRYQVVVSARDPGAAAVV